MVFVALNIGAVKRDAFTHVMGCALLPEGWEQLPQDKRSKDTASLLAALGGNDYEVKQLLEASYEEVVVEPIVKMVVG